MVSDRAGEILKGKYRLIRQIGRGGFADVWLARDVDYLRREGAVKILHQRLTKDEDNVCRFFNEAKLVGSIDARNIVRVSDYGVSNGHHFLVMEYLQGPTLRQSLKQRPNGVIDCSEALSIIEQICDGLAVAANTYGVAHRDLKPENIFLSYTRSEVHVTIVDFGIAKIVDEQVLSNFASKPTTLGLIGTPIYMAPELTRRQVDDEFPAEMYFTADIYSLGVMLYEMLTGSPPFEGPDAEVLRQHLAVMPMRPRQVHPGLDLPESVEALVMRCLEKSPHKRYQSAAGLGEAIRSLPTDEVAIEAEELEEAVTQPRSRRSTGAIRGIGRAALSGTRPLEVRPSLRVPEEGAPSAPSRKAMRMQSSATVAWVPRSVAPADNQGVASARVLQLHAPGSGPQPTPERAVNRPTEDQGILLESRSSTARARVPTGIYAGPPRMPVFSKIVIGSMLVMSFVSMCTIGSAILVFSSPELQESVFGQSRGRAQWKRVRGGPSRGAERPVLGVQGRAAPIHRNAQERSETSRELNSGSGAAPAPTEDHLGISDNVHMVIAPIDANSPLAPERELSALRVPDDPVGKGKIHASETRLSEDPRIAGDASAARRPERRNSSRAPTMASKAAKIQGVVLANCTIKASWDLDRGTYPVFFYIDVSNGVPTKVVSRAPSGFLDDEDCVLRYARSKVNFKGASDLSSNFEYTYKVRAKPGSAARVAERSGKLKD